MGNFGTFNELNRRALENGLEQAATSPLTIVAAPMGYGKTTAVLSFMEKRKEATWFYLALGHDEVDDAWVWQKLLDKVNAVNPAFDQLNEMDFPKTKQQINVFLQIIQDKFNHPFYLIMDDFHECNSTGINRLITRLVYQRIENFHIVLIGRIYPDLPYGEMMLKDYCTIIDQRQFIMSREDLRKFFTINGVDLKEEELTRVNSYTDGWISAAQLVLMEYKKNGEIKLYVSIIQLMKTAIYDKLDSELKEFFMKMSLFDQFTLAAARYTSQCAVEENVLYEFVEKIGFVNYDVINHTYLIHTLLRTVALTELDKTDIKRESLYMRFADWNAENGKYIDAIIYYGKANATEKVCQVLERKERYVLFDKAPVIIRELFHKGDKQVWLRHPTALLSYIYSLLIQGEIREGMALYKQVEQLSSACGPDGGRVKGELLIIQSLVQFNHLEETNAFLKEAYDILEHNVSHIFQDVVMTYGVPSSLILYHNKIGNLRKTIEQEKEYSSYYMRLVKRINGGWDNIYDAEYCLMTGNVAEARTRAEIVSEKAIFRKQTCMIISSYYIMLRCAVYNGDKLEFETRRQEIEEQMKGEVRRILTQDWELAYGYICGVIGEAESMPEWLKEFNLEDCNYIVRCTRNGCICHGLYLIQNKKWVLLDALAEQMLVPFGTSTHLIAELYAYIYKAIAAYQREDEAKALFNLRRALKIASPDSIRLPFMDTGIYLFPLLEKLKDSSPYVKELIGYCRQFEKGLKSFQVGKQEEPSLLTKREMEIMELLKDGCRNQEIGEQLNIALVTVEKTLTNIYRKLNVSNRTAAVNKYEILGQ